MSSVRQRALSIGSAGAIVGGSASALLLAMASSPAAAGSTFFVDSTADGVGDASHCTDGTSGNCTLRDASVAALTGDSIQFDSNVFGSATTITLTESSSIEFTGGVSVSGPGSELLTIAAGASADIFYVCGGAGLTSTVIGMTLTGATGHAIVSGTTTGTDCGSLYLAGLTFDSNIGNSRGPALYMGADVTGTVAGSSFIDNSSGTEGAGALFTNSDLTVVASTFDGNTADWCAGALYFGGDGGDGRDTLTVLDSTFSNNEATTCYGGAIDIDGNNNTILIANTTITGNTSPNGSAIHADTGNDVSIFQSTISGNHATTGIAYYSGAVHLATGIPLPTLTLSGTILAGNDAVAGDADLSSGNSLGSPQDFSANHSILGDVAPWLTNIDPGSGTDIITTDPMLYALADNGGRTLTMEPKAGSPAIDAGPNPVASFLGNAFDQRGPNWVRVYGVSSDIGAFELQDDPTPTTSSTSTSTTSTTSTTIAPDPTTTEATDPVVPAFTG